MSVITSEQTCGPAGDPATPALAAARGRPVVINSYNRLDCLRELIAWLVGAGQRRLYVIDNASTYPPLLDYLDRLEADRVATVVRLGENAGHLAIWRHGILRRLGIDSSSIVYTDPDVVPADSCPRDVIGMLQSVLADNEQIASPGSGCAWTICRTAIATRPQAIDWERQFWLTPAAPGLFLAPIDTTFALYRPVRGHGLGSPAMRTGWPWRGSPSQLVCRRGTAHRARICSTVRRPCAGRPTGPVAACPTGWLRQPTIGRGLQPQAGPGDGPGRRAAGLLSRPRPTANIALPSASVDGIYVADELDRLARNPRLQAELRRVVKPGGRW